MFRQIKKNSKIKSLKRNNAGFTLIELMVTLSIFVIVSSVVLFSQNKFNSSIVLTNLSYDVALSIRQAQTFGIGGKGAQFLQPNAKPTYGVHLSTLNNNGDNQNKKVIIFADLNSNGIYDGEPTDKKMESFNIVRGNYIKSLFWNKESGIWKTPTKGIVDITFVRPDPDAHIRPDKIGPGSDLDSLQIIVASEADGATRSVEVYSTGMISVVR